MKKLIFTALIAFSGIIMLESFGIGGFGKKDGTEPGHTGSPGDTLKNCTVCHGGIATAVEGWIVSDIPAEGYTPGARYSIKATNTEFGATRFGFQVSPQAINGTLLGTIVVTDTARTKLVGNDKYITYREAGVEGVDSLSWEFDWIAPQAGTREVVFYGAFNSNFNGHKDGDRTFLSTLKVQEFGTTGVADLSDRAIHLSVYPNPADDYVNVSFDLKTQTSDLFVELVDLTGKQVVVITNERHTGGFYKQVNTSEFPNGIYLLRINGKTARKISIAH